MTFKEMQEIVSLCKFHDYRFAVAVDGRGAIYLQGRYWEADTITKVMEIQSTRRWFLAPRMTKSEIVQTVFKCAITSMEHRTREWFLYKDRAIFGPHFNVEVLHEICGKEGNFDQRIDEQEPKHEGD